MGNQSLLDIKFGMLPKCGSTLLHTWLIVRLALENLVEFICSIASFGFISGRFYDIITLLLCLTVCVLEHSDF